MMHAKMTPTVSVDMQDQTTAVPIDDMKSTLTATAKSSNGNIPIDIADPMTPGVNVDAKYDTRKPVDHDSAAPERGEQFARHRRAMPVRRHNDQKKKIVSSGGRAGVSGACMRESQSFSFPALRKFGPALRSSR
jgi:hypothetical protein